MASFDGAGWATESTPFLHGRAVLHERAVIGRGMAGPVDVYDELRQQSSLAGCLSVFKAALEPNGYSTLAAGEIDLADRDRNFMYFVEWPPAWRRYYFEQGFVRHDPVVNALGVFKRPFSFGDIVRDPRFSNFDREMMRTAARHGWSQGLVVPVSRGGMRYGVVSMVGSGPEIEESERGAHCLICEILLSRVRALVQSGACAFAVSPLSRRETEALRLVAKGYPDALIAARLGISESTAHKHVESARRKFKAKNRAEMAAIGESVALASAAPSDPSSRCSDNWSIQAISPSVTLCNDTVVNLSRRCLP